jgi:protein-tyrosine kinase
MKTPDAIFPAVLPAGLPDVLSDIRGLEPPMNDASSSAPQAPPEPSLLPEAALAGAGNQGPAQLGPLHITYTQTRVMPDALERLQRVHGVLRADRSELAETFKMLRNQLLQRMRGQGQSVLAVSSPRQVVGKSLTAVNLALAMAAELDSSVLLVDADLSGQGLQKLFGLEGQPGLSEHLTQGIPIPQLLINPGVQRLVLLPAGAGSKQQSAELLGTRATQHLVQELKTRYRDRTVIVDLPPLLDTADALAFLPLADTTLLVVEEHGTTLADIEAANELLAPYNLVGVVMSKPSPKAKRGRSRWGRWLGRGRAV